VLKRLTLSSDAGGENVDGADVSSESSEQRLRRSLDLLSSGPRRDIAEPSPQNSGDHPSRQPGYGAGGQNKQAGYPPAGHTKQAGYAPAGARRHRFKDDGEVPVVHVAPHRDRSAGAAALPAPGRTIPVNGPQAAEERAGRERAERALEAARETIHHLQTRAGHAELALREALDQGEARDHQLAALRQEIQNLRAESAAARLAAAQADARRIATEEEAQAQIDLHRREAEAAREELAALREARFEAVAPDAEQMRRPVVRKLPQKRKIVVAAVEEEEGEPVQWWLPTAKPSKPAAKRAKS
jgi:hypothetical protein